MKKIKGIMQAHMSSSRLPQKVLMDIKGKPELLLNIERCLKAEFIEEMILATSTLECDDILEEKCKEWGIKYYRGSDTDVLERFYGAACTNPADEYIRLTSDNPLNDPQFLDDMICYFFQTGCRYLGLNGHNPVGIGGEVFTFELLEEAYNNSTESFEHEHVTPYMYTKQNSVARFPFEPDYSFLRLTMDTKEDYQVIKTIYDALYTPQNDFTLRDIIEFLKENPEIIKINSDIKQKGLSDEISYKQIFNLFGAK